MILPLCSIQPHFLQCWDYMLPQFPLPAVIMALALPAAILTKPTICCVSSRLKVWRWRIWNINKNKFRFMQGWVVLCKMHEKLGTIQWNIMKWRFLSEAFDMSGYPYWICGMVGLIFVVFDIIKFTTIHDSFALHSFHFPNCQGARDAPWSPKEGAKRYRNCSVLSH